MQLRPYQTSAIERARAAYALGKRRLLFCAPTGAGKTVLATHGLIRPAVENGKPVLVLVHRQELIDQFAAKLTGMRVGVIKADLPSDRGALVQVASVQTLIRRTMPPASLVVVDEAHHVTEDNSYGRILAAYPRACFAGLSATPYRTDGRGLGSCFDEIIPVSSVLELIACNALVRPRTFHLPPPDLRSVRTIAGDYHEGQLASAMDTQRIGRALVQTYQRHAAGCSAIAFAVNVAHAKHIAQQFTEAGIPAEAVDGETPKAERAAMLARLASGETAVVANCGVLTEGFDCPRVSCVILARPTKSKGLWRQMVGRGLRAHHGKADCQIHDHAGCGERFGSVTDEDVLSLTDGITGTIPGPATQTCPQCYAVFPAGEASCPECGYAKPVEPVEIPESVLCGVDEVLVEAEDQPSPIDTEAERKRVLRGLIVEAAVLGWKPGAVGHKFKAIFGDWPTTASAVSRMVESERKRLAPCIAGGVPRDLASIDALYQAVSV